MLINPEIIPKERTIIVNGVIANYLMQDKKVPLLGKSPDGSKFYFSSTDDVNKFIKELPFWMKLFGYC
jgi:hypothetical protein